MSNLTTPPPADLPSSRALVRSTLIALAVAALLLVTVVLPAEYGVDPTGVGEGLGLTEMGRIKVALAREAAVEDAATSSAADPTAPATPATASDTPVTDTTATETALPAGERVTRITLAPGEGKEVKLVMDEGAEARYAWQTDRGVVNYDTHGDAPADPASGRAAIGYHGYGKGMGVASDAGVLVAAFDGAHGWFWRNRTDETVTVTLRTSGAYRDVRLPG